MQSNAQNNWDLIYKQANSGKMADKMANLISFPRYIDIELTNYCNLQCQMCPTGLNVSSRPKGFISSELMQQIILACSQYNCHIRFVRWGEPLLHPCCVKYIKLIKSAGLLCHINTNGMLIDDEFISDILRCKLDSIKFSFQGVTKDEYESMRKGGDYEKLIGRIRNLYNKRNKRRCPFIQIGTTLTKSIDADIKYFKTELRKICDRLVIGRTHNLFASDKVTTNYPDCPEVFDKLSINWDGKVTACCGDWDGLLIIGDIKKQSLKEIWQSNQLNQIREMLIKRQHNLLPVCKNCVL